MCAAVAASAPHLQAAPTVSPPAPAFISKLAAFHPKTVQCRITATFYEAGGGILVEMRLWARPPALWRLDVTAVTPDAPPQNQVVGMRMVPQLVDRVLVARESIWADGRTSEPVRAQLYDPGGRAVGIIVLRDHRRFDRGIALPMTLELFLDPQSGRAATTRVAFQVKEGKFYLPLRVDAYEGTTPVMSLIHSGCEVNRPIDPKRFQL